MQEIWQTKPGVPRILTLRWWQQLHHLRDKILKDEPILVVQHQRAQTSHRAQSILKLSCLGCADGWSHSIANVVEDMLRTQAD